MSVPCLDRDITIEKTAQTITIRLRGRRVAQTKSALALYEADYPVRYYLPLDDVDPSLLKPSAHHTVCPFKGEASYCDLVADGEEAENAVWFYPQPCPQVAQIKNHVSFWGDDIEIDIAQ